MNKVYIVGTVAAIVGIAGIAGLQFADANDGEFGFGFRRSLDSKADVLGISEEELSVQLGEQTLPEIAEDRGLSSDEWRTRMEELAHEKWENMGLSDEEIAVRKERMGQHHEDCQGGAMMGTRRMRNGPGGGWWKE